jgi:hypothetical protein
MPTTAKEQIKNLHLDLHNYRTIPQPDEEQAVKALIAVNPDWFWPLMESLLDDGFEPTENIIVLRADNKLVVKEGNRRVAALKLIYRLVNNVEIPDNITKKIGTLPAEWKKANSLVPCAIFENEEVATVEKLVARTHAKGEKAGRDKWTAVARARFERDRKGASEPGLDLLEKYLKLGKNLSPQQAERWAGDFPLSVLDEAIQKLTSLLNLKKPIDLVQLYPDKHKRLLNQVIFDIGISHLGFKELRSADPFWGDSYGVQPKPTGSLHQSTGRGSHITTTTPNGGTSSAPTGSGGRTLPTAAYASNDPKSVRRMLKGFKVRGSGRDKIKTLLDEIKGLKHEDHPHAFCFLLRSLFELSAKAYCTDHRNAGGPKLQNKDGKDKMLSEVLREITAHMTASGKDIQKVKTLHGATTELAKKDGILSVTSLNQLIHNPTFSVSPSDISLLFGNIFPLLKEMNS